jgi:ribonucleoside-diphosphate reductase alpha chain
MLPESQEQPFLLGLDPLQNQEFTVRKRDGRLEPFNEARIQLAIEAAFRDVKKIEPGEQLSWEVGQVIEELTREVVDSVIAIAARGQDLEIEMIQDAVETSLMSGGHHAVARGYILYREERRKARALRREETKEAPLLWMTRADGGQEPLEPVRIKRAIMKACRGLEEITSYSDIADETLQTLYDGVKEEEVHQAMIMAARAHIEQEPAYSYVSARLLLATVYQEVLEIDLMIDNPALAQKNQFKSFIKRGVEVERLGPELLDFDLNKIAAALRPERDELFTYLGAQTIADRYLLSHQGRRLETPQWFWMRVAMGLAIKEGAEKEKWAIEFYNLLSTFRFVSSTPTLFNSGTCHPQLSSCYLSTVMDDLEHIFKVISDDAKLSKWAGGLGNDWTNVRATGAHIKGTNGTSQGVIPFLKVANDTAVAVNQGGKRKGAMCAYLETWHLDIESFLELRKNTGDERRRTHDMNTANWIPDLFMKRVSERSHWTLFSPNTVPDLHDLYGRKFEERYEHYEALAEQGKMPLARKIEAFELWRKMIAMLFETGHPWITFKDPSNIRSPQDHVGVVHSSNLCTEILLNTSVDEIAVCNLGSINLQMHVTENGLEREKLAETVRIAMRMLDNVVDVNYYPTPEARHANLRHRPVGLGIMGFQDALYIQRLPYAGQAAMDFADQSMEFISYHAILGSTELARERGAYSTFSGSKWDRGLLPIDTVDLLEQERGGHVDVDRSSTMDWNIVRSAIRRHGMRNSNTMAIAPTATISNIAGTTQSIEPSYQHLFVKSNLSGEFTVLNSYLVNDLKKLGLWDEEMVDDLKYYDGSVAEIDRVPLELKELYPCAFEVDATWLIEAASRRQKWIDMGQSLNLYMAGANGRRLNEMYMFAWQKGLKTTYYLRTLAATSREKSTLDINKRGLQPRWMKSKSASADIQLDRGPAVQTAAIPAGAPVAVAEPEPAPAPAPASQEVELPAQSATDMSEVKACSLLDPTCESCQ